MPPLSMLIKPASGLCNMRCRYCFYADVTEHREITSYGIMTPETTEALVRRAFEFAEGQVTFAFQGGEPTLAGEDYYRHFIAMAEKYNTAKIPVNYAMQTNGYHVTDGLCEILRDNHFLMGISLDGTGSLHDSVRPDASGDGTFKKVSETIEKFKKYGIDFNILTVITNNAAKNISQIYNYFRSKRFGYVQFIKHVDGFGDTEENSVYSLTPKRYASFLKTAFGYYYDDIMAGKYMSVREFDNFVMLAAGRDAECCGMNGMCPANLVIEADGGAYPCDFYVLDEWRMGNVIDTPLIELFESDIAKEFRRRSRQIPEKCRKCKYFRLCRGGCARYREPSDENGLGMNKYCESYLEFFEYAAPKLVRLAQMAYDGRIK